MRLQYGASFKVDILSANSKTVGLDLAEKRFASTKNISIQAHNRPFWTNVRTDADEQIP